MSGGSAKATAAFALALATLAFLPAAAGAAEVSAEQPPLVAAPLPVIDKPEFLAIAYAWGISLEGRTGIGHFKTDAYAPMMKLLEDLKFGYMGYAEMRRGDITLFGNLVYSIVESSKSHGTATATMDSRMVLAGAGVAYKAFEHTFADGSSLSLSPYVGARITNVGPTLKLQAPMRFPEHLTFGESYTWADPYVGMRANIKVASNINVELGADFGGLSKDQWSYSVQAVVAYQPSFLPANWSTYAGYRLLRQKYESGHMGERGRFSWDMNLYGPIIGVGVRF